MEMLLEDSSPFCLGSISRDTIPLPCSLLPTLSGRFDLERLTKPSPAACVRSLQLRVLGFGLLQDGNVGLAVFPEDEASRSLREADFAHQFGVARIGTQ